MTRCMFCKDIYAILTLKKGDDLRKVCLSCASRLLQDDPMFTILNWAELDERLPEIIRIDRMLAQLVQDKKNGNRSPASMTRELKIRKELKELHKKYGKNDI